MNADIYCDTQSNILGTNMFTYCNNNAVNQVDPEGTDAIWLQDLDAVNIIGVPFGHSSLLIEDARGVWWFTYWGDEYMAAYPYGNGTVAEFKSFINYGFDPRPHRNYYVKAHYGGMFKNMLYFKGDFSLSLYHYINAICMQGVTKNKMSNGGTLFYTDKINLYNGVLNNCVQSCLDAMNLGLFIGKFTFTMNYARLRLLSVPNLIYPQLVLLMPQSLIIYDDWYL